MLRNNLIRLRSLAIAGLLVSVSAVQAQWFPEQYSYRFNSLLLNPAQAGADDKASLRLVSRWNFYSMPNAPTANSISVNLKLPKNLALGASFQDYRLGPAITQRISADLSYRARLGKNVFFQGGLRATYMNYSLSLVDLKRYTFEDPKFVSGFTREDMLDAGAGILFYSKKFFFGASIPQIRQYTSALPPEFSTLRRTYNVYGGYNIPLNKNFMLRPSILYRNYGSYYHLVDGNLQVSYKNKIHVGGWLRYERSMAASFGFDITDEWYLGYMITRPYGQAGAYGIPLTHEVSFRYQWNQAQFTDILVSPRFFE